MRKETYPGITEAVRQIGGATQRVHVIPCSCNRCAETIEVTICGSRKPLDVLKKIALNRGWKVSRKSFNCPEHAQ